ncbi:MAG: helix-turn-helix domain-containing protein [Bryobacteraceae bacterium]
MIIRPARPSLRPFVKLLWALEESDLPRPADRERVLPTGAMHLAIRLSNDSLRVFDHAGDAAGHAVGYAVVGGARSTAYLRDVSKPSRSVGAQLHAGACEALFGVPAGELAERHTRLDEIWGRPALELRERLEEAGSLERQLDLFESVLAGRLPRVRGLHPAVAHALERFATAADVSRVVRETGYSHRRFIALFRDSVGLNPKLYCRVLRFRHALERICADPAAPCAELALEAGYSDQAHFSREFRAFTGITPVEYRKDPPPLPNHVPVRRRTR